MIYFNSLDTVPLQNISVYTSYSSYKAHHIKSLTKVRAHLKQMVQYLHDCLVKSVD